MSALFRATNCLAAVPAIETSSSFLFRFVSSSASLSAGNLPPHQTHLVASDGFSRAAKSLRMATSLLRSLLSSISFSDLRPLVTSAILSHLPKLVCKLARLVCIFVFSSIYFCTLDVSFRKYPSRLT